MVNCHDSNYITCQAKLFARLGRPVRFPSVVSREQEGMHHVLQRGTTIYLLTSSNSASDIP